MTDGIKAIIFDIGCDTIKAGCSNEENPSIIIPSLVGYTKNNDDENKLNKNFYLGKDILDKPDILNLKPILQRNIMTKWNEDDLMDMFNYIYKNMLKLDSREYPVIIAEPLNNIKAIREKITEIMFEYFGVPSFYMDLQSTFSLLSCGRTTGLVLDCGHGRPQIVPYYDYLIIDEGKNSFNVGGSEIDKYLETLLNEKGLNATTYHEKRIVHDIKEKYSYVALDYDKEIEKLKCSKIKIKYKIDDNNEIDIENERFQCNELFFNPNLNNLRGDGIHKTIFNSIMKCEMEYRPIFYSSIIVSGGSSKTKGFPERLEKEISNVVPEAAQNKVRVRSCDNHSSYFGALIFSDNSQFEQKSIIKDEYYECGSRIVNRKCIHYSLH